MIVAAREQQFERILVIRAIHAAQGGTLRRSFRHLNERDGYAATAAAGVNLRKNGAFVPCPEIVVIDADVWHAEGLHADSRQARWDNMKTNAFRRSPSGSLTAQYLQCLSFLHLQLRRLLWATVAEHQVAEAYQIPFEPPQAIDMFLGPK